MHVFFSKKLNFMADLHRKYVCISSVAVVEIPETGSNSKILPNKIVTNSNFF